MIENFTMGLSVVCGAIIGSFLNVVIGRLPLEGASIVFPGSHCPACKEPIRWYDNIPVISFILLRARCRSCGRRISPQYPVVELAMALLSLALFLKFSLSWAFGIYFLFSAALLVVIFIDFHHGIIPDGISLPGIVLGFVFSFVNPFVTWQDSGLGIVVGGGSLLLIFILYYLVTKVEGMGMGDVKLLAMIGAFLGWQSLPFVVLSSSVMGSLVGLGVMLKNKTGGKTSIPYGPFLSMGSLLYLFFQEKIQYLFILFFLPQ